MQNIPRNRGLERRPAAVGGAEVDYDSETDIDRIKRPSLDIKVWTYVRIDIRCDGKYRFRAGGG